jgi:hypothetical protein
VATVFVLAGDLALMWKRGCISQGTVQESRNTSEKTAVFDPRFRNRSDSFLLYRRKLRLADPCLASADSFGDFVAAGPMSLQRSF